jgi:hypothetical protein
MLAQTWMKKLIIFAVSILGILVKTFADDATPISLDGPGYWSWAPPMGWNSWDAFATTITEDKAQAKLIPWRTISPPTAGNKWWFSATISPAP